MIIDDNYAPAFPVTGMMKDFDIALAVANEQDIPLPLLTRVRENFSAAASAGVGNQDFFVLVKQLADAQRSRNGV